MRKEKNIQRATASFYIGGTLFSGLVTILYYVFDHGLRDPHMTFLFLVPLLPALFWYILAWVKYLPCPAARYAFNLSSPFLWFYFLLMGIYTMAKTVSDWLFVYLIIGITGYCAAAIIELVYRVKTRKKEE